VGPALVALLDDARLTALARGAWPALERLDLRSNHLHVLALEDARCWAPALVELHIIGY
jgi:hypothetical protein